MNLQVYDTSMDAFAVILDPRDKEFRDYLYVVKLIHGRWYDERIKAWIIPKNGFPTGQHLRQHIINGLQNRTVVKDDERIGPVQPLPELTIDIKLKKEMRAYQKKGVAYCLKHDACIIADQQGLGKTIQAIAAVEAKNEWPGLVITKNSLRLTPWEYEFAEWTDRRCLVLTDSVRYSFPTLLLNGFYDVAICNYESLRKYFVKKIRVPPGEVFRLHHVWFYEYINLFKWVIVDESHYVKDMLTKRTKFTAGICQGKKNVYLLSGTPALNHAKEVYTQICILNKQKFFGSYTYFQKTYCGKKNEHNLPRLNKLLTDHCFYRRTKQEVAKEIPSKTRQIILCDIDNRDIYDRCERNFKKFLSDELYLTSGQINKKLRAEALTQMMELKKLAAHGKLPAVKEWIESMIDQEEKFVLFAFHQDIQQKLKEMAPGILHLGGGRHATEIKEITDAFWNDKSVPGLICSISADSEGHNLQVASNGGHVELPWHYGKCEQGEDRIHRIGTSLPVTWAYFLAEHTIDRKLYKIIMEKKEMHDGITGSNENIETETIDKMINLFNQ